MNPVIRAQLREFAKANSIITESEDSQFEIYSIFSILNGYLSESIEAYDVHLTGDEFGIDGVAIIIQGETVRNRQEASEKIEAIKNPTIEFVFFQSKTSTHFDYGEIGKFYDAVTGFFNDGLREESEQLDDLIAAKNEIYTRGVGRRNPKLSCYYVTTGNYERPTRIEKQRVDFCRHLSNLNMFENNSITVQMVGARELQQWYRAATSSAEVDIDFPENVVLPSNTHVEQAYIGYIDAKNLLNLFVVTDDVSKAPSINRSVFYDNIRDYDPGSAINVAIKHSVRVGGGGEFIFRNNGITVVSRGIERTADRFKLKDYQIVNGCQTSNIVFDLVHGDETEKVSGDPSLISAIQVPFRLIVSNDDDFVSSIIIGTNRQNPVRDDQFWALRPFMKNLEDFCRSLDAENIIYIERRQDQYRKVQNIERTRIMQPSTLMKVVAACWLFQPQRAGRDYRGIISDYERKIFQEGQDVRMYHAAAYLYYRLEFLWRNYRIDNSSKKYRYFIIAGIGLKVTNGNDIFSVKKQGVIRFSEILISMSKDEDKLKASVAEIVEIAEDLLRTSGESHQSPVRDAIRSEAFAAAFRQRILP